MAMRRFGIDIVGMVEWGRHLCQFYQTKEDLVETLVPYFMEGLRSNEFCVWITSPPLEVGEARQALRKALPDLDDYLAKGQIEILSYEDWHLAEDSFDAGRVLQAWIDKERSALARGFDGLRLTGNTFWVEPDRWKSFVEYEAKINEAIVSHHMIALCTYCLDKCSGSGVVDVVKNHVGTLIRKEGAWYLVEDTVERREAEELLRETEQRWATTLKSIGDAVIATDVSGRVTFMNAAAEALTGWTLGEASQKPVKQVFRIINEHSRRLADDPVGKVLKNGEITGLANHTILLGKDGKEILIDNSGAPIREEGGEVTGVVLVFRDVTERRRLEENLERSEEEVRSILEGINDGFYALDRDWNYTYINNRAAGVIGLTPQELVGQNLWERLPRLVGTKFEKILRETMLSGKATSFEWEIMYGDIWTEHRVYPTAQGLSIYWTDITERRRAEDALRETRDYLDSLFNYANAPIICWDPGYRITRFNHAFESLTGYAAEEVIGRDLSVLFPEESKAESLAKIRRTLAERWEVVEIPIQRKDGDVRVALWNSANVYDEDGKTLLSTIAQGQDITERKKMEDKLEQYAKNLEKLVEERTKALGEAERLAAIGETTLMVGHDIRNPLQSIVGEVYLMREELDSMPEGEEKNRKGESLDLIDEQLSYVDKIVSDLQDYARPLKPKMEEVNIKQILDPIISTVIIPKNIKTVTRIDENLPLVMADPALLRRALVNMVTNAIQAMPSGGTLTVEARNGKEKALLLSVEDTGGGIPEEVRSRLFRPFTTTKSKGQGLGLAVCKRIVDAHHGDIGYETWAGRGTKFTMRLPM